MSEIKTILNFFDKNNGLDKIVKDLKEIKKLQEAINKQKTGVASDNLKERTAALKEITRLQKLLDKERKKANDGVKKATGIEKELLKVEEQRRKVNKDLKVARTEKFKDLQESRLARQEQVRLVKAELKETSKLVSLYDRESAKLNRLRKELKNVILAEGEGSVAARKLQKEVTLLDTKLKKVDASAGQFQRNVGNYPNALKGAIGALKNFAGALGITAGITGLVRVIGDAINIAKDFEQSNANLAAVLGTTKESIGALTNDAKRLGSTTAFTASQVSELQTEFAKLGFNEQEILNATEATLSLAAATGSDLGEAAAIAGATLGGFGLEADETQRVVDVMAKSFSTSALDIEKFRESMKVAAPAARAVGVDVEKTTALLGTLANAGISGSLAGTGLAKSFIQLNKAGLTLEQGLEKVAKAENKLDTAVKLVGVNAAKSFLILAEGTETTEELERGLNNAGGAAERMAKEQLNTLQGSLTILNSAWEGFVLGLLSGDSAFSKLSKTIVEATTSLLGFLTPAENLGKETQKLNDDFEQQEKVLNPLLQRYDELKEQGELNEDQQRELKGVINDIVEIVPDAATGFDVYGNALDINKDKVIANTKAQKELLAELAGQDIEEIGESFIDATQDITTYQEQLEKGVRQSAELQKVTGQLRRELTVPEAKKAAIDIRNLDSQIQENIQTLVKFGLTQEEIIDLFDKSGRANQKQRDRFIENLNVVVELNKATKENTEDTEENTEETDKNTESIDKNTKAKEENAETNLRTEKEIEAGRKKLAEEAEERRKAEARDKKNREDKEEKEADERLKKAEERQKLTIAQINSDIHEQQRLAEERKKRIKEGLEDAQVFTEAQIDFLKKEAEARIDSLDRQIDAENDFINQNENLSAEEIEFRRKKAAELELERIQEQKRLEKLAKVEAFFELVAAFAKEGDGLAAIGKATAAIATAEAATAGFHDGGYTGDGNEYDSAGIVHKGEFVNTKKQTSEYGMKGWTAKDFDKAVDEGYFNQFANSNLFADQNAKFLSVQNNQIGYDFKQLESKLDSVVNAVNNSPTTDFEINGEYFIKRTKRNGSTTIKKRKLG